MNDTNTFFQKIFQEKQQKSKKRLDEYIQEQGEDQIHNLRTSIRRLVSTYLILPNSCKRNKTDDFVSSYKSLFKKNSTIRDYDIIISKLLKHGLSENSDTIKFIVKQKEKKLKEALKYAKKIRAKTPHQIKIGNSEKTNKKYDKTIFSLITKIQEHIPVVASDESKIEELHTMRKNVKKLRYVLELAPNGSYIHVVDSMKLLQKYLGDIHDCDIAITFLKKHSKIFTELQTILLKEQEIRSQIYKKLANSLSDKIIQ